MGQGREVGESRIMPQNSGRRHPLEITGSQGLGGGFSFWPTVLVWKDRELASHPGRDPGPGYGTFILTVQQNARLERVRGRLLLHLRLDSLQSDIDIEQLMYCTVIFHCRITRMYIQ